MPSLSFDFIRNIVRKHLACNCSFSDTVTSIVSKVEV